MESSRFVSLKTGISIHQGKTSRYGLRGVRVGEASHPGPVQTPHARRLQSTLVDSDAFTAGEGTQIDLEDDTPMICGRLSASSGAIPHVHVSHVRTAEDSVRVASPPVPSSSAQGRDGVPRKRLRLCQTSTAINSSVLDALEEDLHGSRGQPGRVRTISMLAGTQFWRRTARMICQ